MFYLLSQAGLDVMLSVPRRANDAMYVNMLHGYDVSPDGNALKVRHEVVCSLNFSSLL